MRWPWSRRSQPAGTAPIQSKPEDISCKEIVEIVNDYVEGALSPADREAVELHLNLCDGCTDYLEQLRLSIALTGELPPDALSPELEEELCHAFRSFPRP
jgi:anti-sigma factor RsiW